MISSLHLLLGMAVVVPLREAWRAGLEWLAWLVAGLWCWRTYAAMRGMPTLADLRESKWDRDVSASLTVIVPARNEAAAITATLQALLAADYHARGGAAFTVLAVDDRSEDSTGEQMEAVAAEAQATDAVQLRVLRLRTLPPGWLGKTHALQQAMDASSSDYILFTDADVLFSPSVLRRAVAFAEAEQLDHLVVLPTMQVKGRGEGMMLGFLQVFGLWAARPWKIGDPKARDTVGVGAFNLVRRSAMQELGGWEPQRMAVLEDITLGRRMKAAGRRQRLATAPSLVLVHWARGARGLVSVMTKNVFSAFGFQPLLLLAAVAWIVVVCLGPVAGLAWWPTLLPSLLTLCCIGAAYRVMADASHIDPRYAWLYPAGASLMLYAMLRSMVTVMAEGGVTWRGTFYPMGDLRRFNRPQR